MKHLTMAILMALSFNVSAADFSHVNTICKLYGKQAASIVDVRKGGVTASQYFSFMAGRGTNFDEMSRVLILHVFQMKYETQEKAFDAAYQVCVGSYS